MSESGYNYANPDEPRLQFSSDSDVSAEEISVRLADYHCDIEVGLTQSRSIFESSHLSIWLDQNASEIRRAESLMIAGVSEVSTLTENLHDGGVAVLPDPPPPRDEVTVSTILEND